MASAETVQTSIIPALDGPTVIAAAVTAGFAVLAGVAIGNLPQDGALGGALDAVKNIIYMITVPMFDLTRRAFLRRAVRSEAASATVSSPPRIDHPDVLRIAIVTALVLFIIVEVLAWLMGFAMGVTCINLGHQIQGGTFGPCLTTGIGAFATVLMMPLMMMLAAAGGWIWQGLLPSRFWLGVLFFMIAVAGLFSLDYFIMLQQNAPGTEHLRSTFAAFGPVRQVSLQVAILTPGLLLGYFARRIWRALTRRVG